MLWYVDGLDLALKYVHKANALALLSKFTWDPDMTL